MISSMPHNSINVVRENQAAIERTKTNRISVERLWFFLFFMNLIAIKAMLAGIRPCWLYDVNMTELDVYFTSVNRKLRPLHNVGDIYR